MTYHLFSTGKLIDGAEARQAVAAIARLTGLSEAQVRDQLLNGQRRRLAGDADKGKINKVRDRLLAAGLAVEVVADVPAAASARIKPPAAAPVSIGVNRVPRRLAARVRNVILVVLAAVLVVAAAGWYWLNRPLSDEALAIEDAIADGTLVAIAHVDVAKIVYIKSQWFGESDPGAIPIADEDRELVERLFTEEANLRENLQHAFFAVHSLDEQQGAENTLVLQGQFDEAAIRATLASDYRLESLEDGRWSMISLPKSVDGLRCPEKQPKTPEVAAKPHYLHITPRWLLVSSSEAQAQHVQQRLAGGAIAAQPLDVWRNYRRGQLASLMVFTPAEASKGVNGFPGMIARKASSDTPQVTGLAARVGLDPLRAGVQAGLRVFSADAAWNRQQAEKLREGIASWSQDSQGASPSLGQLLSRISAEETEEYLQIGASLDGQVLSEIGQTAQEAVGRLFSVKAGGPEAKTPEADAIMTSPIDYAANAAFDTLPNYEANNFAYPLFIGGSFAANVDSVSMDDEGLFEFKIKGEVALPKADFNIRRAGTVTLAIDEVSDIEGKSLLRDERCLDRPLWNKANHEPEISESLSQDKAWADKKVRLEEGAVPTDVAVVKGRLIFTSPVQVKRFALLATAGSHVEHMGLRFYVNGVGRDGSVSYQLSGEKDRFLELRALNKDGLPLQTSWSMGDPDKGRKTQYFKGTIQSLEIHVAERYVEHKAAFTLNDLFVVPPGNERAGSGRWFAPQAISARAWEQYAGVDVDKLHAGQKGNDNRRLEQMGNRLATVTRGPISMEVWHKVEKWGNSPQAIVFYPMIADLPGVLSALSYRIEEPAREKTGIERYARVFYSYRTNSGEVVVEHQINGQPFDQEQITLNAGLKENEKMERLKGSLRFRLPTKTASTRLDLDELWPGKSVDGVTVTLKNIDRGIFPGYALKIEGAIDRLVNLHGLDAEGQRIAAEPMNFQEGGYWTMTLPFTPGMREVELVLATEQKVYDFPFDLRPNYPNQ